jgi:hypothetical protein
LPFGAVTEPRERDSGAFGAEALPVRFHSASDALIGGPRFVVLLRRFDEAVELLRESRPARVAREVDDDARTGREDRFLGAAQFFTTD